MHNNIKLSFTVITKEFSHNLNHVIRLGGGRYSKTRIIQIRVLFEYIELVTQGVVRRVKAVTEGEGEISIPAVLLKTYLSTNSSASISFTFRPGELECGSSRYSSSGIEVYPISLNPQVLIPINLSSISVLRYGLNNTEEEIERLNLTGSIKAVKRKLKSNILEALDYLEEYGVNYDDLENLVNRKIKNEA